MLQTLDLSEWQRGTAGQDSTADHPGAEAPGRALACPSRGSMFLPSTPKSHEHPKNIVPSGYMYKMYV